MQMERKGLSVNPKVNYFHHSYLMHVPVETAADWSLRLISLDVCPQAILYVFMSYS
jgi:hypothetical protein